MNQHYPPRPLDPWDADRDHLPAVTDREAPTEWFPAAQFPTERLPTAHLPTAHLPTAHLSTAPFPREQCADPPAARPREPLAHEGGLAYGNPPAAPFRAPEEFLPQHLASPSFGAGPFYPGAYPQPFMPQQLMPPHWMPQPLMPYPHPMQQTVFVTNGGGRRVNHALHLILTVLSFGLWLPVWAILAIANS